MNADACSLVNGVTVLWRQREIVGGVGAAQPLRPSIRLLSAFQLKAEGEAEVGDMVATVENLAVDLDTNCPVQSNEERQPDY